VVVEVPARLAVLLDRHQRVNCLRVEVSGVVVAFEVNMGLSLDLLFGVLSPSEVSRDLGWAC